MKLISSLHAHSGSPGICQTSTRVVPVLALILLLPLADLQAQETVQQQEARKRFHHEVPDQPYMAPAASAKPGSPGYTYRGSSVFTVQVNVDENGQNIPDDAANEPSIAINPLNPDEMVIGWRQFDNIGSNFRQAGYGYTQDGGETWTFPGVINQGVFRSDPVLDADSNGVFHYNSLTSVGYDFSCQVFRSDDGGLSWDDGTEARGGDKQWMVIDKSGGEGTGHLYSFWTVFYSSCYPGAFTRSIDGGNSYQNCVFMPGSPYWGTMAVGPDGKLFITGAGEEEGVVVVRSTNAQNPSATVTWDLTEQVYLDGHLGIQSPVNPDGLMGQANICVDASSGSGRGNIYVMASVIRATGGDPADIMFSGSFDGGVSWSLIPIRINDDPENDHYQWFGTMSVAPDGRIDVVWLDTRDAPPGSYLSALYYSFSTDEGETWSPNERLSELFDPHVGWPQQMKMGDYFDMKSDEEHAHLAWANTLNGEQDVYYSRITPQYTGTELQNSRTGLELSCFPNPVAETVTIRYLLQNEMDVKVEILNLAGQKMETLVSDWQSSGMHTYRFHAGHLPPGYYFCRITAGNTISSIPLIKMRQ